MGAPLRPPLAPNAEEGTAGPLAPILLDPNPDIANAKKPRVSGAHPLAPSREERWAHCSPPASGEGQDHHWRRKNGTPFFGFFPAVREKGGTSPRSRPPGAPPLPCSHASSPSFSRHPPPSQLLTSCPFTWHPRALFAVPRPSGRRVGEREKRHSAAAKWPPQLGDPRGGCSRRVLPATVHKRKSRTEDDYSPGSVSVGGTVLGPHWPREKMPRRRGGDSAGPIPVCADGRALRRLGGLENPPE